MSFAELGGCQVACAEQEAPFSLAEAEVSLRCMPRMVLQHVCNLCQGVSRLTKGPQHYAQKELSVHEKDLGETEIKQA